MCIPVFDAHCDTISRIQEDGGCLRENMYHIDLTRASRFIPYAQVFAVFTRPREKEEQMEKGDFSEDCPPNVLENIGRELLNLLLEQLKSCEDIITLCLSASDARKAASDGKMAAFIAVEGAELLGSDISLLEQAYAKGVRLINLCWNYDNPLCGSALGPTKSGLTQKGREYVREMQRLGIAVDMSHASERTFWDTAEISQKPILAGHSNSRALCDFPRNLTDNQFRELVRQGGAAGLNLCPDFLQVDGDADIEWVIRHCEHFLELGGEKSVCLGGDLDGIGSLPKGMKGIESYGEIYEAMLRRNYPENLVRDIFYNNLMNVLERAL